MKIENSIIVLSEDSKYNFVKCEKKYWPVLPFFEDKPDKIMRGGNGIIFRTEDPDDGEVCIIKFFKFSYEFAKSNKKIRTRILRFQREIEALNLAADNELDFVVRYYDSGNVIIDSETYPFYIMEKCDCNLTSFLNQNEIELAQKLEICRQILLGIEELHRLKIYHRDIKSDNIFFLDNKPLIADLGLADYRKSDYRIYEKGDIIGPIGWLSPEATNKFLVEGTTNRYNFDCKIGVKSDLFQLGKLFWYVFQENLPIGQIILSDFKINDEDIFNLIFNCLQYDNKRRNDLINTLQNLNKVSKNYQL